MRLGISWVARASRASAAKCVDRELWGPQSASCKQRGTQPARAWINAWAALSMQWHHTWAALPTQSSRGLNCVGRNQPQRPGLLRVKHMAVISQELQFFSKSSEWTLYRLPCVRDIYEMLNLNWSFDLSSVFNSVVQNVISWYIESCYIMTVIVRQFGPIVTIPSLLELYVDTL